MRRRASATLREGSKVDDLIASMRAKALAHHIIPILMIENLYEIHYFNQRVQRGQNRFPILKTFHLVYDGLILEAKSKRLHSDEVLPIDFGYDLVHVAGCYFLVLGAVQHAVTTCYLREHHDDLVQVLDLARAEDGAASCRSGWAPLRKGLVDVRDGHLAAHVVAIASLARVAALLGAFLMDVLRGAREVDQDRDQALHNPDAVAGLPAQVLQRLNEGGNDLVLEDFAYLGKVHEE